MPTFWLSLAGSVSLAFFSGLGGLAVAGSEPAPVHVTGTIPSDHAFTAPCTFRLEAGVYQYRGCTLVGPILMSDSRLSGEQWSTWNYDGLGTWGLSGMVATGTFGIDNDEGSWAGTFSGVEYPASGEVVVQGWLAGDGDYEGLSAYLSYVMPVATTATVEGLVFMGETPPVPELPAE